MQLHLDPLGGMAGDMFIAALLDCFPEHEAGVLSSIRDAGSPDSVQCRLSVFHDGVLQGRKFNVDAPARERGSWRADDPHDHAHTTWALIRDRLESSALETAVGTHAIGIFSLLAEAESRVHGVDVDSVVFHEVGAADSIADIVGAAHLIAALGATRWTVGPLPLGSGRIHTAHGVMPVPAPAAALLLESFLTLDDGLLGERVTPTGAAILRYLCNERAFACEPRTLVRSGVGFGAKKFPGLSNCVRVLAFEEVQVSASCHRELGVIEFEVDDISAEDLAMGLDRLRGQDSIFDVVQAPVFGKKGRMMTYVRILARASALDEAIASCFRETTTIGLRHRIVSGMALPRSFAEVDVEGTPVRVKIVERPGGLTAKAEADDAVAAGAHSERAALRRKAERLALAAASAP